MAILRTPESHKKYLEYLKNEEERCFLCEKEPLKSFRLWYIVENSFPYDQIAKEHHMLIPIRHVTEKELTPDEREEMSIIKESFVHKEYDWIIEAAHKNKSIPSHFHLHLIVAK